MSEEIAHVSEDGNITTVISSPDGQPEPAPPEQPTEAEAGYLAQFSPSEIRELAEQMGQTRFPLEALDAVRDAKNSKALTYYFAENPDVCERLFDCGSALEVQREIRKLDREITRMKEASRPAPKPLEERSYSEFRRIRERQEREYRRRG